MPLYLNNHGNTYCTLHVNNTPVTDQQKYGVVRYELPAAPPSTQSVLSSDSNGVMSWASGGGGGSGSKYFVRLTNLPQSTIGNGGNRDPDGNRVPSLINIEINDAYTTPATATGTGSISDFVSAENNAVGVGDAWVAPKDGTFMVSFSMGLNTLHDQDGNSYGDQAGYLAIVSNAWNLKTQIGAGAPVIAVSSITGGSTASVSGAITCAAGDKVYFCLQVNQQPYGVATTTNRPEDTLTIAEI